MGRESRQSRRARERRDVQRRQEQRSAAARKRAIYLGGAVVLVALVIFGILAFKQSTSKNASGPTPIPTPRPAAYIDGIGCLPNEQFAMHIHSHLSLYDRGRAVKIPAGVGINYNNSCYYWLHTHNPDGVIHEEFPKVTTPILKNFFDIWHKPISRNQVYTLTVRRGQVMKVWVNGKRYSGDPGGIKLKPHTNIYMVVGPPFVQPKPFIWGNL